MFRINMNRIGSKSINKTLLIHKYQVEEERFDNEYDFLSLKKSNSTTATSLQKESTTPNICRSTKISVSTNSTTPLQQ